MPNLITVDLGVLSDDILAGTYGSGAKVYLDSAATEEGTWSAVTSVAIVSGTESYDIWDPDGTSATWYKHRVGNAGGTVYSDYCAAFQVGVGSYTSLALVKLALGIAGGSDASNAVINGFVAAANGFLNGRIGLFIGPSSDTARVFSGQRAVGNRRRLYIPGGIRAATAVTIGATTGATQTTSVTTDWFLGPDSWERAPGSPYGYIELLDVTTGNWSYFPAAARNVTVTGTFGWSAVPADLEELATRLAVKMFEARQSGQRDIIGTDEMGQPIVSRFMTSLEDKQLIDHYAAFGQAYRYFLMAATPQIEIRVNAKDLERYDKALAKLQGKPLYERVDKSLLAVGNKIVAAEARRQFAASRRAPHIAHAGKRFGTSITARKTRQRRMGEPAAVTVKPRTPLAHLVIQGTKAHSLATKRAGKGGYAAFGPDPVRATAGLHHPGSQGNPFMDRTRAATDDAVAAAIVRDVFGALR